jgi:hypothetical protein
MQMYHWPTGVMFEIVYDADQAKRGQPIDGFAAWNSYLGEGTCLPGTLEDLASIGHAAIGAALDHVACCPM